MTPADRIAAAAPELEPVLTAEEAAVLGETGPSEAALAAIAAAEAREIERAMMRRFRL